MISRVGREGHVRVGLTGGIGSGKSSVAALLREAGLEVLDADQVAREIVEPGMPALAAIAERFGPEVLTAEGALDRAAMAAIVFDDAEALAALEAITHPAIGAEVVRREAAIRAQDPEAIVVIDHPLLVETDQSDDFDALVVVLASREVRLQRLVEHRGMDAGDVRARMATQADDEQRRRVATWLIDNDGDLEDLARQVDEVVAHLQTMAA